MQQQQQLAALYAHFYGSFAAWAGQRLLQEPLAVAALSVAGAASGLGPVACLGEALTGFLARHQVQGRPAWVHAHLLLRCLDEATLALTPVVRQVLHSLGRSVSRHLNAGRMLKQFRACLLHQLCPQLRRRHQQSPQQPVQNLQQHYLAQPPTLPQASYTTAAAAAAAVAAAAADAYEEFQQQQFLRQQQQQQRQHQQRQHQQHQQAAAAAAAASAAAAAVAAAASGGAASHLLGGAAAYPTGSLVYQHQHQQAIGQQQHYAAAAAAAAAPLFYPPGSYSGYYCCPPAPYPGLLLHFLALLDGGPTAAVAAAAAASTAASASQASAASSSASQHQHQHQHSHHHHQHQHPHQHHHQPSNLDSLLHLAAQVGGCRPRGAAKEELDSLPTYRYQPSRRPSETRQASCVVCLAEFEPRQQLRGLACGHEFHTRCVDRWLRHNRTCPVCRADAVSGRPQASAD